MPNDRVSDTSNNRSPRGFRRPRAPLVAGALCLGTAALVAALLYVGRDQSQQVRAASSEASATTTTSISSTSSDVTSRAPGVPLSAVAWESLSYPVDCGGQTTASATAYPEPEPGKEVAIVQVTCKAGAGSPPSAVLVYDSAESTTSAHLAQTLLRYEDNWIPESGVTTSLGPTLTISVYGYSTDSVPRCCPDLHPTLSWTWRQGKYVATGPEPTHARLPSR